LPQCTLRTTILKNEKKKLNLNKVVVLAKTNKQTKQPPQNNKYCASISLEFRKRGNGGKLRENKDDEHCYLQSLTVWEELMSSTYHLQNSLGSFKHGRSDNLFAYAGEAVLGGAIQGSRTISILSTLGHFNQLWQQMFMLKHIQLKFIYMII
jgi:hypothetical protein